jgi:hypothetical protein
LEHSPLARQNRLFRMVDMSPRRPPINTSQNTTIVYPSGLFSLERDEVFPYEKFASNLLDLGIEMLDAKDLSKELVIDFTQPEVNFAPWLINASVQAVLDASGTTTGYRFRVPKLLPTMTYLYAVVFARAFIEGAPSELRYLLSAFVEAASAGARAYKKRGFAHAIRASYDHLGLTFEDLHLSANAYDLLTKQIACHEVGHVYALHLEGGRSVTPVHRRAFELIADLLTSGWIYHKMIRNTPDTEEYRQMRGVSSHSEAIFSNCLMTQRSQEALLCFMALAGAQRSGGVFTLDGGRSHPPGLQRYFLQVVHFDTFVRSNFTTLLSSQQIALLSADRERNMTNLRSSGVVGLTDVDQYLDLREFDTIEAAADLIEEMNVQDLMPIVAVLREARELTLEKLQEAKTPKPR